MKFYTITLKTPRKRLSTVGTICIWLGIENRLEDAISKAKTIYPEKRVIGYSESPLTHLFYLLPFFNKSTKG